MTLSLLDGSAAIVSLYVAVWMFLKLRENCRRAHGGLSAQPADRLACTVVAGAVSAAFFALLLGAVML